MSLRFIAAALAALATVVHAAPGDLDNSFAGGYAQLVVGQSVDLVSAALRQDDGKIVVVGSSMGSRFRLGPRLALARYMPDGALDPSFGQEGRASTNVGPGGGWSAVIQPGGKIVVAATCGTQILCLVRLFPDGGPDPSFGVDGSLGLAGFSARLTLQPDGKIVGVINGAVDNDTPALFRATAEGALDPTFGGDGVVEFPGLGRAAAALVQADGKVILAGFSSTGFLARRVNPDGSNDPSFVQAFATGSALANAALLQPDGMLVIAGCVNTAPGGSAVLRVLPNGAPDTTFGNEGLATFHTGCAKAISLRPDGRLLVSRSERDASFSYSFEASQLLPNGTLDPAFGNAGRAFIASDGERREAVGQVLLPDGKAIVAGNQWGRDFALARILPDGSDDATFGTSGKLVTELWNGRGGNVVGIGFQGSKTLVALRLGEALTLNYTPTLGKVGVARFHGNGTRDTSFGVEGHVTASMVDAGGEALDVRWAGPLSFAVLPDGRFLVGGQGTVSGQSGAMLMRFTADGTLDASFGTNGRRLVAVPEPYTQTIAPDAGVQAIRLLPDGRILVAGKLDRSGGGSTNFVARLLANGSPDASFATNGVFRRDSTVYPFEVGPTIGLAPLADGRVTVAGMAERSFSLLRLTAAGMLDATFGNGGILDIASPSYAGPNGGVVKISPLGVVQHADGRIAIPATAQFPSTGAATFATLWPAFARVTADGFVTTAAPGTGVHLGLAWPGTMWGHTLDSQDRTLVSTSSSGFKATFLARLTSAGALDTGFGTRGIVTLPNPAGEKFPLLRVVVAVDPDGKIMAAGDNFGVGEGGTMGLYRLEGLGTSAPAPLPGDMDADGNPDANENADLRDPMVRDNDVLLSSTLFARQQYRDFLGREGDSGGVGYWGSQLDSGAQTRARMVEAFLTSAEFQGTGAPVVRLYFASFLRIPDFGGLTFWMARFREGLPLGDIAQAFATSPEFLGRYGALDNGQFVRRLYRNVLGRDPDPSGLANWTGRMDAGLSRGAALLAFSESAEYQALIANEVLVTMTYAGMLRRAPDAGGFAFWVDALDRGYLGISLLSSIVSSPEYRARFLD